MDDAEQKMAGEIEYEIKQVQTHDKKNDKNVTA